MRRSRRDAREDLRLAVQCLPPHTRLAMLDGVRRNDIIVGAYTDRKGGVCPMLAAHRNGGRTDFLAFAHAWDRFTHAKRPRRATPREIRTLVSYLESTQLEAEGVLDLGAAVSDHQALARDRREREARGVGFGWLRRRARDERDERPLIRL
jgi:hypothetical protein